MKKHSKHFFALFVAVFIADSFLLAIEGPCSDRMLKRGKMKSADYQFCLQLDEFISQGWKNIALAHAVSQRKKDCAEIMVRAGADVNALPILHRAVKNQDLAMTEFLLASGAKQSLLGQDKTEPAFLGKSPRQVIEDDLKNFCFSDTEGDQKKCNVTRDFLVAFDKFANSYKL